MRLFIEVEQDRLVVEVIISSLLDCADEIIVSPSDGRVLNHEIDSVIILIVVRMEIDSLSPQKVFFADSEQL